MCKKPKKSSKKIFWAAQISMSAAGFSNLVKNTTIRYALISSIFYIFISANINMHVYAQFSILCRSSKFKKIQIQFLEDQEVIWPQTKK